MSNIQRWNHYWYGPDKVEDGSWVTYGEHVAALESEEMRLHRHYEQVVKDAVEFAEEAEGRSWQQAVEELVARAETAEAALDQMTVDHLAELLVLGTKARAAGLQEARDAVAACPEPFAMSSTPYIRRREALAAIDRLSL